MKRGRVFDTLKVLIVEGKRGNGRLLYDILTNLGVRQIVTRDDSQEALRELRETLFDAVFCDEQSTPVNPAAFARALRKDAANVSHRAPIVLMSGAPQRRQVEIARDCGINDFLAVPISIATVKKKLMTVLFAPKRFVVSQSFAGPDRRHKAQLEAASKEKEKADGHSPEQERRTSEGSSHPSR
jgi:PleD family two-component response regulator